MTACIRVVIADDEPAGRRAVQLLLADDPDIQIVGQCRSGQETAETVLRHRPDLLFLDVQMPGGDGFEALAGIPVEVMPLVVFVTAFDEYALRAFAVEAADYLLKPFTTARFRSALLRAKERLRQRTAAEVERVAALQSRLGAAASAPPPRPSAPARITIRTAHGTLILAMDDIDWIEARGDYVRIHAGDRVELLREPIGRLEERLDSSRFVRVHRSAIVNLARVREIRHSGPGETVAVLTSGGQCRLSRSGRDRLASVLGQPI